LHGSKSSQSRKRRAEFACKRRWRELPRHGVALLSCLTLAVCCEGQIRRPVNCYSLTELDLAPPGALGQRYVWELPLDVQREPAFATSATIECRRARILEVETIADARLDADAVAATTEWYEVPFRPEHRRRCSQLLGRSHRCFVTIRNAQQSAPTAIRREPLDRRLPKSAASAFRRELAHGGRTWWRKRRLRRRHEGSCLSEDSLFGPCGCSRCFGDRVFGGAFPLTGRRAVLAAASASKRISALRSVTVALLIGSVLHAAGTQGGGRRQFRSSS